MNLNVEKMIVVLWKKQFFSLGHVLMFRSYDIAGLLFTTSFISSAVLFYISVSLFTKEKTGFIPQN